jgi:hypothetical protein
MTNDKDFSERTTEDLEIKNLTARVKELEDLVSVIQQRTTFSTRDLPSLDSNKLYAAGVRKCIYCDQGVYQIRFHGRTASREAAQRILLSLGLMLPSAHFELEEYKQWVVINCDYCGNFQYFKLETPELLKNWE